MEPIIYNLTPVVLVQNDCYWLPYVLSAIDGWFEKIVIYDVGSTDGTLEICRAFKGVATSDVLLEEMPAVPPKAQLAFRNAMIAEAQTDYYLIVDGDEIWPKESLEQLRVQFPYFQGLLLDPCQTQDRKTYGIVRRIEVREDLQSAYAVDEYLPHHRVYHRTATWRGTHPGERATIPQQTDTEYRFSPEVKVFHFHNTLRSTKDAIARQSRKDQRTYHRGTISSLNILEELPILRNDKGDFPVNPELEKLWLNANAESGQTTG